MSLKYGLSSLVLFLVVLFLAGKSYDVLTSSLELPPAKEVVKKSETKTENPPRMAVPKESAGIASSNLMAQRNIFSPERKDFPVTGSGTSTKPVARPQVILCGVTLAEDYQSASVINPGRPLRKGEKEQMTIRPGERIGEYKLAKISPDRITLEAGEDSFEVLLYDPKMPKKRVDVRTEIKPSAVTGAQTSSTPTVDVMGGTRPASASLSPPASPAGPKRVIPQEQSPATTSTQATSPPLSTAPPGSAPAPAQVPVPMTSTPVTPPFSPTSFPIPPGMSGKPVPLPPGGGPPQ